MSIANVVCRGFGPSAAIKFVVTRGFSQGIVVKPTTTLWDTSDPVFYDYWRALGQRVKQSAIRQSEPEIKENNEAPLIKAAVKTLRKVKAPLLDELLSAQNLDELRGLSQELNAAQRRIIARLIADFEREQEEREVEMLLLAVI